MSVIDCRRKEVVGNTNLLHKPFIKHPPHTPVQILLAGLEPTATTYIPISLPKVLPAPVFL